MAETVKTSNELTKLPTEKEREEKLMQDVLLLLANLFAREETTIKLILNCLYDVGATNLINQKIQFRTLNRTMKVISKMSKPAFRMIAWQWFKTNCPNLIVNWLRSKIEFKIVENVTNVNNVTVEVVRENQDANLNSLSPTQYQIYEVKHLRSQVKLLTGILVGSVTVLAGSFVWTGYLLEQSHIKAVEELQTQVKTLEANVNKR
jgi:ABC-type sugar transport system permease subunit